MTDNPSYTLCNLDGNPFDWSLARRELNEIIHRHNKKRQPKNQAIGPRISAILDETLPDSCFAISEGNPYVPGDLLKEAASAVFKDHWSTEIIESKIVAQGPIHTAIASRLEAPRQHLVVQCILKVTVHSSDGKEKQSHSAIGIAGYDIPQGDGQYMKMYRIVCKGAETNALRAALERFGNLFSQRDSLDQITTSQEESAKKPQEKPKPLAKRQTKRQPKGGMLPVYVGNSVYKEYPNTPEGMFEWLSEREGLVKNTGNLNDYEKDAIKNDAVFTQIKETSGGILAEQIESLKTIMSQRVAILSGIGKPPRVQAKRQARPLESSEVKQITSKEETEKPQNEKTDTENGQSDLFAER